MSKLVNEIADVAVNSLNIQQNGLAWDTPIKAAREAARLMAEECARIAKGFDPCCLHSDGPYIAAAIRSMLAESEGGGT